MKCTSCKVGTLNRSYLDNTLPCFQCDHCGGHFLKLTEYLTWLNRQPKNQLQTLTDTDIETNETLRAMICPESGDLMTKYRISKETDHKIDLNSKTGAIWLDKGEWLLLKQHNIHTKLNKIFTHHWQQNIRNADSKEIMDEIYQRKFGNHYQKIKQFKAEVCTEENKNDIVAYLLT